MVSENTPKTQSSSTLVGQVSVGVGGSKGSTKGSSNGVTESKHTPKTQSSSN
jgi:hypothetical protein